MHYTCISYIIGQPVGWCISDRENTEVMQHFLQSLKDRSPNTVVSVLMTDDGKFVHITNANKTKYLYVLP